MSELEKNYVLVNLLKKHLIAGAKASFSAIFDANITTLLAAAVLFFFGTSSVKGFATLLIISILVIFITAVWASRVLLGLLVNSGYFDDKTSWFGIPKKRIHPPEDEVDTLDLTTKFDRLDFVKHRKKFYVAFYRIYNRRNYYFECIQIKSRN